MDKMFIAHRINTLTELKELPTGVGLEFDIRDNNGDIVVEHDPYVGVLLLSDFLKEVGERFLIVNVKSEGIESRALKILEYFGKKDFFLLDCSFPMMYNLFQKGETRLAVRFSEFESIETVISLQGKVQWVWVDCFTHMPLTKEIECTLHEKGFKICIVSPELQNQADKRSEYMNYLQVNHIYIDAMCSKIKYY
jgi:hypothetical protein